MYMSVLAKSKSELGDDGSISPFGQAFALFLVSVVTNFRTFSKI
jgi:hypothetical protein